MKKIIFVSILSPAAIDVPVFHKDSLYTVFYKDDFYTGHSRLVDVKPSRLVMKYDNPDTFEKDLSDLEEVCAKHGFLMEVVTRYSPSAFVASDDLQ